MIRIIEDDSFESQSGSGIAIPVVITLRAGLCTVTAYKEALEAVRQYAEHFSAEPLSDNAIAYITKLTDAIAAPLQFARDTDIGRMPEFELSLPSDIRKSAILPTTARLTNNHGLDNLTGYDLEFSEAAGLCSYGTVIGGKIVSISCEAPYDDSDAAIELGVETASGYNGKGYAASNVAALANDIVMRGKTAFYTCDESNSASCHTALTIGFHQTGVSFSAVYYPI